MPESIELRSSIELMVSFQYAVRRRLDCIQTTDGKSEHSATYSESMNHGPRSASAFEITPMLSIGELGRSSSSGRLDWTSMNTSVYCRASYVLVSGSDVLSMLSSRPFSSALLGPTFF